MKSVAKVILSFVFGLASTLATGRAVADAPTEIRISYPRVGIVSKLKTPEGIRQETVRLVALATKPSK